MPLVRIVSSAETPAGAEALLRKLSGLLARELGKPEAYMRYEDLILQSADTLSSISAYLGLDHPIVLAPDSEGKIFSSHSTSPDPASSIGRWKRELNSEDCASFSQSFQPFLEAFGYDTGAK